MTMQTGAARAPSGFARWRERRRAECREIELAALDLHERYGAAAYGIARNSALRGGRAAHGRFWRQVAARLRRIGGERRRWPLAGFFQAGPGLRAALRRLARA